jgi:hypothetical protein
MAPKRPERGPIKQNSDPLNDESSTPAPPLLKAVGRRKQQNALQRLDELNRFMNKFAHDRTGAGELFPVRKAVGRPRPKRD